MGCTLWMTALPARLSSAGPRKVTALDELASPSPIVLTTDSQESKPALRVDTLIPAKPGRLQSSLAVGPRHQAGAPCLDSRTELHNVLPRAERTQEEPTDADAGAVRPWRIAESASRISRPAVDLFPKVRAAERPVPDVRSRADFATDGRTARSSSQTRASRIPAARSRTTPRSRAG